VSDRDRPSNTHVHGSGGRLSKLANLCLLPALTRSLVPETVRIIPRMHEREPACTLQSVPAND
jgi:hypothetical protein